MDIDLDFADRNLALGALKHIPASIINNGVTKKHNTGVYLTNIPTNPVTGLASIDYKEAEERNYFKIDFLNVAVYKNVTSEQHLIQLLETEPIWDLLLVDQFTDLLFHVHGYGKIMRTMQPKSVTQLAAVLAAIRPAKLHLVGKPWDYVMQHIWTIPTTNEYFWKKSHAFAYASAVVVQMNLLCEQLQAATVTQVSASEEESHSFV